MELDQQLFKYLAIFILLGVGVGAQAEIADKPEWSIDSLPRQNNSWCSINPYRQQNEKEKLLTIPYQQQNESGWSIGPRGGIIWGKAREIVFDNSDVWNKNDYLSELIWDLRTVFVFGVDSLWRGKRSNGLGIKFSFAIPKIPVGKMEDYDWYYTDRDWSHWSQSDVRLRWGFIFDFLYEGVLVRSGYFNLKLGAGYHMDWWGWKDKVVDSVYSTYDNEGGRTFPDSFQPDKDKFRDRPDILEVGRNGINYWVMYHVFLISLRGSVEWDTVSLSVLGRVGPVLGVTKDHHLSRLEFGPNGVYFYDIAFGGPWVDTILEVGFKITDRFSFSLQGEFTWLNETRGLSVTVPTGTKPISAAKKAGGFAFQRVGVSALVFWKLGQ